MKRIAIAVCLVVLVLAVTIIALTPAQPARGKKYEVKIRFDTDLAQIVCVPHTLIVKKLDSVEWECVTGQPFTLDFGWGSPFSETSFPVPAKAKKEAQIPDDARQGQYKYSVAIYDEASKLVYTLDPDLIIRGRG
jgi:hypothetical protein